MTATATAVRKGTWYPEMPPLLDGEDRAGYAARLCGLAGTDLVPYDHRRSPRCAAGRHGECGGRACQCPHHRDAAPKIAAHARAALTAGAVGLTGLFGLPEATGLRLMALTREVAKGGPRPPQEVLRRRLAAEYDAEISGQFAAAVAAIYRAAVTGELQGPAAQAPASPGLPPSRPGRAGGPALRLVTTEGHDPHEQDH